MAACESFIHQPSSEPAAPQWSGNSDSADPQRRGDQPEIAGERTFCPQQQMPGLLVEAVEIGKGRALLDDKDPLAEPKQLVEAIGAQHFKALPFGGDLWLLITIEVLSSNKGSAMEPRD